MSTVSQPSVSVGHPALSPVAAKRLGLVAYFIVFCAAIVPYLPTLRFGFVYDDDVQVRAMPALEPWHMLPGYFVHPVPGFTAHYYRPLFFLWLELNRNLWGSHSWGWHLGSVLLHAVASVLVLAVLRKYLADIKWAALGALIFAVHPVHVESVAWISGSTDSLMSVSLLGSLCLWMRSSEGHSFSKQGASLVCAGLAILAKETAVVLPAIIFLHAILGIPRGEGAPERLCARLLMALRQALPYLSVAAACLLIRSWVLREIPRTQQSISLRDGLLTIPSLLVFYLKHLFWPSRLSLHYDLPIISSLDTWSFWIPLALLAIAAVAGCLWALRTREIRAAAATGWFLLPLLPVLYLPLFQQDDFVHDRYLYLPVISLSLLVGRLAEYSAKPDVQKKLGIVPVTILGLAVISLSLAAVVQARPWKSNLSLYTNAVEIAPHNMLAKNNLAREYAFEGHYQEAAEMFREILDVRPTMWLANYNYGFVNYRLENFALAERYLVQAIKINASDPDQYICLGTTYLKQGRLGEAEQQVRLGIARKADGSGYHLALAIILLAEGKLANAREELQQELQDHPENAAAISRVLATSPQLNAYVH